MRLVNRLLKGDCITCLKDMFWNSLNEELCCIKFQLLFTGEITRTADCLTCECSELGREICTPIRPCEYASTASTLYILGISHINMSTLYILGISYINMSTLYILGISHINMSTLYILGISHINMSTLYILGISHINTSTLYTLGISHINMSTLYILGIYPS